jgi:hypothetical protein
MKMFERVSGVRIEEMLHEMVNAAFNKHKKQYKFHPLKVFALPSCIAVIDSTPHLTQTRTNSGPSSTSSTNPSASPI